ncbi:MAG: ribokinase [Rhodobacteraceae bacterium]|nr:ribokinase [Paracoccaceae bacterium]
MSSRSSQLTILGAFVADAAFRATRPPLMGETLIGLGFNLGPGGKGSNQAVAAARLGANVSFISRLGDDAFANLAQDLWRQEGIEALVARDEGSFTGAAYIYIDAETGDNAIIVVPGAAMEVAVADIDRHRQAIERSSIFMTQLETPLEASRHGLAVARKAGVTTILNPAPAAPLDSELLSLCDYLVPNEGEAGMLTGMEVVTLDDAAAAASKLRERGAETVIITLGEKGAFYCGDSDRMHIPAVSAGEVSETTGAGDCFCGAFAWALDAGFSPDKATRYASCAAAISVTRPGTAPSMPTAAEVTALFES